MSFFYWQQTYAEKYKYAEMTNAQRKDYCSGSFSDRCNKVKAITKLEKIDIISAQLSVNVYNIYR